jgi:hypothetical protein
MTRAGLPHSDTPGSQLGCQLPRAYRRLQRPSSALDAKASTMCPSQLATTNTTPHPNTRHDRRRQRHATKETHTTRPHPPPPTPPPPTGRNTHRERKRGGRRAGSDRSCITQIYRYIPPDPPAPPGNSRTGGLIWWRCSRPLFTSQTTTPHHPPTSHRLVVGAAGTENPNPPAPPPMPPSGGRSVTGVCAVRPQNPNSVPPPLQPEPPGSTDGPALPGSLRERDGESRELPLVNTPSSLPRADRTTRPRPNRRGCAP